MVTIKKFPKLVPKCDAGHPELIDVPDAVIEIRAGSKVMVLCEGCRKELIY